MIRWDASSKVSLKGGRWLVLVALALSAGLSLASLGTRHLFDDEILSLPVVTSSAREIVKVAAEGDVHPAGMYLLAHAGWLCTGSLRWLNLLPWAVLYGGLAVYVWNVAPLMRVGRERVCFVLLATLHPELLVWGNTFRWYCPWTGLALLVLIGGLQPRRESPKLSTARVIGLGAAVAAMFYVNYITVLFGVALLVAMWVRFKGISDRAVGRRLGGIAATALVLVAPQLRTMLKVHLAGSGGQRSGVAVSAIRLLQAIVGSEAYLPWHPIAVIVSLVLVGMAVWVLGARRGFGEYAMRTTGGMGSLLVFGGCFGLLMVVSGLGGKARNGLLLVPVAAPLFAMAVGAARAEFGWALVGMVLVWEGMGAAHVLGEYGLQKADRNDRPEDVVALVRREMAGTGQASSPGCGVVFTYDTGVTFAMAQAKLPGVLLVSPSRGPLFQGAVQDVPENCAEPRVFLVESYPAGLKHNLLLAEGEAKAAEESLGAMRSVVRLDRDPDAEMKRRLGRLAGLATGASLPDWRFVVVEGSVKREEIAAMRSRMPHFVSGQPD